MMAGMDLDTFLAAAVDLLAVQSTADRPDLLRRAVDCVVDFVGPGFRVERFESAGKPSALLYADRFDAAGRPDFRVILNAHLDVVPGEPEQFNPRREGDRLYARGAQDMKISALVEAQVFRELAAGLPYPLALQLVIYKHGASDGAHYSGRGIAAVAFGVGGAGQHGPEEYAEISTIVPYHRALREFLEGLGVRCDAPLLS